MTATRTFSDTQKAIEQNFANGKQLTYTTIKEYEELPKCDRKEYVLRAVATNETLMKHITEMEKRINDANNALKERESRLGQMALVIDGGNKEVIELKNQIKRYQSSFWYKLYKAFR